jgi:ribose transport system ATP-binding protein
VEKSLVAIARALAVRCDFLVLDEPTASLPRSDVEGLFDVLRQLRDEGVGMIYVSHRLDEVFDIADRVVVLRDGETVGVRNVAHATSDELVDLIVGRKPKTFFKQSAHEQARVLEIKGLQTEHMGPIDFSVAGGEILGLVGLRGAGQEQVGRCLFGCESFAGHIEIGGKRLDPRSPAEAMAAGVGLIPRDRVVESVAGSLNVRENFFVNPGAVGRGLFSFMTRRAESKLALSVGEDVGLRPNDPELPIESLSGGNQQKVVVGRWLQNVGKLLVAEDPTAGVDVGAKADIYALLNSILDFDGAVLVISTDFEEVAKICHRALVFSRGAIISELTDLALTTEALVQAASASDNTSKTLLS